MNGDPFPVRKTWKVIPLGSDTWLCTVCGTEYAEDSQLVTGTKAVVRGPDRKATRFLLKLPSEAFIG